MRWLVFAVWLGAVGVAHAGVAVVGLSGDATFTVAPGPWRHRFVAYMDGDKEALPELSIAITEFQADSGRRAVPVTSAVERFGGKGKPDAASFTISVDLPTADTYVASLVVSGGDRPLVRQLTLQVGATAAPGTKVPAAIIGPSSVEVVGDAATLRLDLRNLASVDHTFDVARPSVVRQRNGRRIPAELAMQWSLAGAPGPRDGGALHLPGGGDGIVEVTLEGAEPGQYTVELQLGEPGVAPTGFPGEVFLKRGPLCAILLIAVGVLLASAISRVRDVWLDSQAQRINLGRVVERLQLEASGDAARDALRELRRQATDLDRAISDRRDCRTDIENLGRRAVVFVRANGSAAEIAELDDERRAELRRKLDEVFRLVALPTGEATATDKLSELEDKDAERKVLKAALDAFAASVDNHRLEADAAFTVQLGDLAGRVTHLRELYQRDELDAAQRELAEVRDLLGKRGREAIQRACESPPAWTSEASWTQAMAGVKPLLASSDASYEAVHAAFVDASVALTVKEAQHPEVPQLDAARDMTSRLQLMAKIHAEIGPQTKSISIIAGVTRLFSSTSVHRAAPPRDAPPRAPTEPFEWRTLARRSMRVEVMMLTVVMAVAVVAGVKALWIDNPIWGSSGDLLGAFLWGSGVQVGAEAFIGLAALRAALGRRL